MAGQRGKQFQELSHIQLLRRAHSDEEARGALAQFNKFCQKLGEPLRILYILHGGYQFRNLFDEPIRLLDS